VTHSADITVQPDGDLFSNSMNGTVQCDADGRFANP
jgi:hypothetical protein